MFLVRSAFWLSVVVLFLPNDPDNEAPRVTLFQALDAGPAAVSDMSQLCDRNPDVCATGGAALDVIVDKARHGLKMLGQHFSKAPEAASKDLDLRGTLTDADILQPWHGGRV